MIRYIKRETQGNTLVLGFRLSVISLAAFFTGSILPKTAGAQFALPEVTASEDAAPRRPLIAAEAVYHVRLARNKATYTVSPYAEVYPVDSINRVVRDAGTAWIAKVGDVKGLQLDPAGEVYVAAGQEAVAQRHIAARLAMPGLSLNDRGFTYLSAVRAFSDQYFPARLPFAEAYLKELDALGDSVAIWQFQARVRLIDAYYKLGRSPDIGRLGTQAVERIALIPFPERGIIWPNNTDFYLATVEALAGLPDGGRAVISRLDSLMRAGTVPPTKFVALDSAYTDVGAGYRYWNDPLLQRTSKIAMIGPPLVANYWFNTASHDSAVVSVNDGKIRVIQLANTSCPGCIVALHGVQRMQGLFPQIETLFLTYTYGYWGNRLVEPDEEVPYIVDFLQRVAKITMPVGIWKVKKVRNEDDGYSIPNRGANFDNYPTDKMSIWVIDGHGRVRRCLEGLGRDSEASLANTIRFLLAEAKGESTSATSSR